jgi:hypothetical protein
MKNRIKRNTYLSINTPHSIRQILARHILCFGVVLLAGCAGPKIVGTFDGKTYTSVHQDYSVPMPQMAGGDRISGDDDNGVTFHDDFGSRISFYSLPFLPSDELTAALESGGNERVLKKCFEKLYGSATETHYHSEVLGGIMSCIYCKQSSSTKTSAAGFVHSKHVYLVEVGLPEATKLLTKDADADALRKQDQWLENRAVTLVQTIQPKVNSKRQP